MRKFHKNQILKLADALCFTIDEIERLLHHSENIHNIHLLIDIQDNAKNICELIRQCKGEGPNNVTSFVNYCENFFYDISKTINSVKNDLYAVKKLKKQLLDVKNGIFNEIKPNKIEIVFLPYKASMWDSFESIWLAAKADPCCDVYVVPIPYYDRRQDGTFGEIQYEASLYPAAVQISDWLKYDIEAHCPDVIFIHNPYDEDNYITSVHPDFYSARLKRFTGLLCYVPYFVSTGDVSAHFCVLPGTLHADKVFLESDRVKATYIRFFEDAVKQFRCEGMFGQAEHKFIALGSPKYDNITNTSSKDYEIPNEWQRLLEKPDGKKKKVILYNTSITMLLNKDVQYLNKLKSVLSVFKEQIDLLLWWRPHPLSKAMYSSMRPKNIDEYEQIVKSYKSENWGIYDDSSDLHRAIAFSDAYYGDWSSLASLCQCKGMPVMQQNTSIIVKNDGHDVIFFRYLFDDETYFWFTAFYYNALFKMNKQTNETEYVGSFPNESIVGDVLYTTITGYNGKLFFTPCSANDIAIYDPVNNKFEKVKIRKPENTTKVKYLPESKFFATARYKNWIFLIGFRYPAFVRYDMVTGQVDYYTDWLDQMEPMITEINDGFFYHVLVNESRFVVASSVTNVLVEFDMEKCVSKVFQVGGKTNRYFGICFDGKKYWMSPRNKGPIVSWNLKSYELMEYDNYPAKYVDDHPGPWDITYANGRVWVFPNVMRIGMALKINPHNGAMEIVDEFLSKTSVGSKTVFDSSDIAIMTFSNPNNKLMRAHACFSNHVYEYNCEDGSCRIISYTLAKETLESIKPIRAQTLIKDISACKTTLDFCFRERTASCLLDFLEHIVLHEQNENTDDFLKRAAQFIREVNNNLDDSAGNKIYSYCKQEILSLTS